MITEATNQISIQELYEIITKSKIDRTGYILLPSIDGFKLFAIDEDRLKTYLYAESLHSLHKNCIHK
jgi:hypothetical protein